MVIEPQSQSKAHHQPRAGGGPEGPAPGEHPPEPGQGPGAGGGAGRLPDPRRGHPRRGHPRPPAAGTG